MSVNNKLPYAERVRERIQTSMVLDKVINCALGKEDMTEKQLKAAITLLNKTVPNLSESKNTNEHSGSVNVNVNRVTEFLQK